MSPIRIEIVQPFMDAVHYLFSMMLKTDVTASFPKLVYGRSMMTGNNILASLDFNGPVEGTASLILPQESATILTRQLLRMESGDVEDKIGEAITESINIIAGFAKTKFDQGNQEYIDLGLPKIQMGENLTLESASNSAAFQIDYFCDFGAFCLAVSYDQVAPELLAELTR